MDAQVVQEIDAAFQQIQSRDNDRSLLRRCLTQEVFDQVKGRTTSSGASLLDLMRSGLANPDSSIGVYAADSESYEVFAPLLDSVLETYHQTTLPAAHPSTDFGDPTLLSDLKEYDQYIISTRIRCARSVSDFPFTISMSESQFTQLESSVSAVLGKLTGDLQGDYHTLSSLSEESRKQLLSDHLLYKDDDRFLRAANAYRHWPAGRGIFLSKDKGFSVWCNEEDHIRIIVLQSGANFANVYARFIRAVQEMSKELTFAWNKRAGSPTLCPTNAGTGLRASVHVKLPMLGAKKELLEEIAAKWKLQVRGVHGEHSEAGDGGVFDISNKRRLGISEFEAIKGLQDGIVDIIKKEKELVS